ncbi:helix-turn-helix transcriptional regulator [Agrobacterium sp.]|uniref:helix-turn-helix transcriptional regulator n=1 Tax=Agrobacterium sp. TaxID=361 RepID=UPI0028A715C6|nr:LuxR C-terminal-related transcriptional regulator [Agrobacterium sp.]
MTMSETDGLISTHAERVTEIEMLKTQFDVFRFLKGLTETWGMKAFMVVNLPTQAGLELSQHTIITNWPAELLQSYDNENLIRGSTVLAALQKSTVPFFADADFLNRAADPATSKIVKALFERFEMLNSIWCPAHDVAGVRGAVSFSGNKQGFTHQEIAEIAYVSTHIFDRLSYIKRLDNRVPDTLTDRELDCLNWTAAGKTSAEIAEILILSEHTVNHYLNRATKKLDTVNRTQAVAKALRVGLIK